MPEGDTVHLAASRLRRALAGRRVTRSDFRVPRFATADLAGRVLDDVVARGKHLLFRFDRDLTMHTHFEMDGSWHLYRPDGRWRAPAGDARVVLVTDAWVAVGFRLPVVELLPTSDEERVVGHLGPDVLGDGWDAAVAAARVRAHPRRALGEVLIDQTVIAGLGNVYKSEICFLAGIDPHTPVAEVAEVEAVAALAQRIVAANRSTGGQITTGDTRRGRRHWVYGRAGRPCRRCGTAIAGDRSGGRVTYWCPLCQRPP